MSWLNYHHLYYFWTIVHEGSIAKAAQKLSLGQPTLSTQLKQLEDALGQNLFERKNRRLVLTESGRIAYEYANEIFRIGAEMVEAVHDRLPETKLHHVQIGALDSVAKHFILRLTQAAYKVAPCKVSILEGRGDELLRELSASRLDLIIANYPPATMEDARVYAKCVKKLPVAVYAHKKLAGLKKNFPQSLIGQNFVLPTLHSKLRHDLDHYFKVNELSIHVVAESQDTSVQVLLGASGVGLVPISEISGTKLPGGEDLIRLGYLENISEEIWLISASRKVDNPIAAKLMKDFTL
jgi:LysR family transcriptional regulator, transcriptional activator of nhaA